MKAAKFLSTPIQAGPAMPEPYRQLCTLEPDLLEMWCDAVYYAAYWDMRPVERLRGRQASWRHMRADLLRLVGPGRDDGDDILGSISAYECAALALRAALGMGD
jgi:hypothetical protein